MYASSQAMALPPDLTSGLQANMAQTERDRQRQETRRKVYDAALEIFRRDGVQASKIDDITQLAGVSRGTFYFHFPSKDDVLTVLMNRSQMRVVTRLDDLGPDTGITEVLELVAATIAVEWKDEPQMLAEIGMVALRQTAQNLPDLGEVHPVRGALIPWLEKAAARGEIAELMPPNLLAEFFLVNVFGAALAWVGNPVVPLDQLLRNVVQFFLKAART